MTNQTIRGGAGAQRRGRLLSNDEWTALRERFALRHATVQLIDAARGIPPRDDRSMRATGPNPDETAIPCGEVSRVAAAVLAWSDGEADRVTCPDCLDLLRLVRGA